MKISEIKQVQILLYHSALIQITNTWSTIVSINNTAHKDQLAVVVGTGGVSRVPECLFGMVGVPTLLSSDKFMS